jgi:hypothetical protein
MWARANAGVVQDAGKVSLVAAADTLFDSCAANIGGAVFNQEGILTCTRCDFTGNRVGDGGTGGAYAGYGACSGSFVDCKLVGNVGPRGAAFFVYTDQAEVVMERTLVADNKATAGGGARTGGGIECYVCGKVRIANSVFARNTAGVYGSAVYVVQSTAGTEIAVESTTFIDNPPPASTSGTLHIHHVGAAGEATINNSIIHNPAGGPAIYSNLPGAVGISHSILQNAKPLCDSLLACGPGVSDTDPLLTEVPLALPPGGRGPDRAWAPSRGSPALDVGVNVGGAAADFAGNPRVGAAWRSRG